VFGKVEWGRIFVAKENAASVQLTSVTSTEGRTDWNRIEPAFLICRLMGPFGEIVFSVGLVLLSRVGGIVSFAGKFDLME
jgi:hypothetical protein